MASGKVKWFNSVKGYGFIENENGPDIFVHHTAILGQGYKELMAGEVVSFELVPGEKGPKAINVQRQPPRSQA
jgi:CspA family cold shock protein